MKLSLGFAVCCIALLPYAKAKAQSCETCIPGGGCWDPCHDAANPGDILGNVGETLGVAREQVCSVPLVDGVCHAVTEVEVAAGAPLLEAWFNRSRDDASFWARPIPPEIRLQLEGFVESDLLDRVLYNIGDPGIVNLANVSIEFGDKFNRGRPTQAVMLIDIIVFKDAEAASDPAVWAHELHHMKQFRDWGVHDFAVKYLRDLGSQAPGTVEGEAYARQAEYERWRGGSIGNPFASGTIGNPNPEGLENGLSSGAICATPNGTCRLNFAVLPGRRCTCQTSQGTSVGVTQ